MAEFLRRARPRGLAKAPSSRERSWRIGCTRMTLPSFGQLDRSGDDGDVDEGAGPHPASPVGGPGEGDLAVVVRQPGHGQPGGGVAGLARHPGPRGTVAMIGTQPLRSSFAAAVTGNSNTSRPLK
jgi:hypothetical protein